MSNPSEISPSKKEPDWGSSYRLIASEKWRAKSAVMGKAVTETLVEYARPRPGMRVLDLASGTGEPAITLAGRVGAEGQVIGLDLSADLLEIAMNRAKDRGLMNFVAKPGDAHDLPFENESFDLATSRFGVMFFREPMLAMQELLRVLKPGARACFAAWGAFEQPYWQSTMAIVHRHVGGPLLAPGAANPFSFAKAGSLSNLFRRAGFRECEEESRTVAWTWPGTPEEVWEQLRSVAVPFRPMLEGVPADLWPRIHEEVQAAIGRYVNGENIEFTASIILASGSK
jgi:ubiquinone/menaquinone biosynthesis C-methylase UbiE